MGEARMLAACRGEPVDRTPVWFMRQAGRCLAGYRRLRERHDILEITRTPELCAQVTTMPVDVFGVDGAVLYADIMLPLYGMGVPFSIDPGVGPIVHRPVRDAAARRARPARGARPGAGGGPARPGGGPPAPGPRSPAPPGAGPGGASAWI